MSMPYDTAPRTARPADVTNTTPPGYGVRRGTEDTNTLPDAVKAALWAARHGWHVHPLRVDQKAPLWDHWETRATTDPNIIMSWPTRTTGYGIACGPSGLYVIDGDAPKADTPPPPAPDVHDGLDMFALLAEQAGESIEWGTFQVTTGRGGSHLYYSAPQGCDLRNTAYDPKNPDNSLGWLIDTRGGGGYVVGPGSVVNGRRYTTVHAEPPAPLSMWVVAAVRELKSKAASQGGGVTPLVSSGVAVRPAAGVVGPEWVSAALRGELDRLMSHGGEGGRNHALNSASYTIGRLVGAGLLKRAEVELELVNATSGWWGIGKPPFTRAEAERTVRSGLAAGERNPRVPQPREQRKAAAA